MIRNKCSYRIWPAISSCGRTTGFVLQPGESNTVAVPSTWFGILWGRTLCSEEATGKFSCITGDWASRGKVAPPVTVVELVLNGTGGNDLYAVSLVKGFSLPVTVESQDLSCTRTGCVKELNVACPKELKVIRDGEGSCSGTLVISNKCRYTVWPVISSGRRNQQGESNTIVVPPAASRGGPSVLRTSPESCHVSPVTAVHPPRMLKWKRGAACYFSGVESKRHGRFGFYVVCKLTIHCPLSTKANANANIDVENEIESL
ncbi:PR5-like receptor kinase [Cajanus cajan]|uniref:PR5-like receptor kinase n=1 Tax=Cajanus cajan TaxID=3821 RepID=UPI00098D88E9|nr:PR5-like receptor kinase [Cajanus cajan]